MVSDTGTIVYLTLSKEAFLQDSLKKVKNTLNMNKWCDNGYVNCYDNIVYVEYVPIFELFKLYNELLYYLIPFFSEANASEFLENWN